jgi:hypothetical protein
MQAGFSLPKPFTVKTPMAVHTGSDGLVPVQMMHKMMHKLSAPYSTGSSG